MSISVLRMMFLTEQSLDTSHNLFMCNWCNSVPNEKRTIRLLSNLHAMRLTWFQNKTKAWIVCGNQYFHYLLCYISELFNKGLHDFVPWGAFDYCNTKQLKSLIYLFLKKKWLLKKMVKNCQYVQYCIFYSVWKMWIFLCRPK